MNKKKYAQLNRTNRTKKTAIDAAICKELKHIEH
jgi:hypothetical protein